MPTAKAAPNDETGAEEAGKNTQPDSKKPTTRKKNSPSAALQHAADRLVASGIDPASLPDDIDELRSMYIQKFDQAEKAAAALAIAERQRDEYEEVASTINRARGEISQMAVAMQGGFKPVMGHQVGDTQGYAFPIRGTGSGPIIYIMMRPVRDSNGNVVTDEDGDPILTPVGNAIQFEQKMIDDGPEGTYYKFK
jgi:hypothetical protein